MLFHKLILICFSQLTLINSRNVQQKERQCHVCWFALFPAKIREISRPRLNAWLNKMRDWKVETKGNHEKNTIGTKMAAPIPASYIRAISRTESHSPTVLSGLFHVMARHKTNQPVAIKASALANKSGIVNFDNTISKTIPAIIPIARRPCRNRTKVGRVVDFFGVAVKSLNRRTITRRTIQE